MNAGAVVAGMLVLVGLVAAVVLLPAALLAGGYAGVMLASGMWK